MSVHAPVLLAALALLAAPVPAVAQQGPGIDILTGEPVKPRSAHPRPEPEIFNAPHAPRQEQRRADDPPIEIYAAPQIGGAMQQDPYGSRRSPPTRRWDDGYRR